MSKRRWILARCSWKNWYRTEILQIYLLIPLIAGFLYATSALVLKKALLYNIGPWRTTFVANWFFVLATAILLPASHGTWLCAGFFIAIVCGFIFLGGQCLTFLAMQKGDVSVATPIMGTKILFVALFWVLLGKQVTLWDVASALLAVVAIVLLQFGPRSKNAVPLRPTLVYSFSSAMAFALMDVLIAKAAETLHPSRVMFVAAVVCAMLSFTLVPRFSGPLLALRPPALWWLLCGAALIAAQSAAFGSSIVFSGDPTGCNIIYASRGLWAVLLVWVFSKYMDLPESSHGNQTFFTRSFGSLILIFAVALQFFSK